MSLGRAGHLWDVGTRGGAFFDPEQSADRTSCCVGLEGRHRWLGLSDLPDPWRLLTR